MKHNNSYKSFSLAIAAAVLIVLSGAFTASLWGKDVETITVPPHRQIVMASTESRDNIYGKWLYLCFREAFKRMGFELVFKHLPAKRASLMAERGLVDGELARIKDYANARPILIRVDSKVFKTRFVAFSRNPEIRLDGWGSLKGTSYTVRYMLGVKMCETNLPKVVSPENLHHSYTVLQAIRILFSRNEDLYIDEEISVISELRTNPELKGVKLHQAGVMEETFLYPFLHIRNRELAPHLSRVLMEMKQEGLIDQFLQEAFEDTPL